MHTCIDCGGVNLPLGLNGVQKTTKNCRKTSKSRFSQKPVFWKFEMVLGRSRGVRGHGMDHTKRFPRTLARFGLTWHRGSRFSCFWKYWKLTSSRNTSNHFNRGPKKMQKKKRPFGKKWRFGEVVQVPGKSKKKKESFFWKWIGYTRRFMLVKHENRFPPCHVRPNPAKLRGNRFAWFMPCPRTPPDLPYSI